jgi:hypothetical protein
MSFACYAGHAGETHVRARETQVCRAETHVRQAETTVCRGEIRVLRARDAVSPRHRHTRGAPATQACQVPTQCVRTKIQVRRTLDAVSPRHRHTCGAPATQARRAPPQCARTKTQVVEPAARCLRAIDTDAAYPRHKRVRRRIHAHHAKRGVSSARHTCARARAVCCRRRDKRASGSDTVRRGRNTSRRAFDAVCRARNICASHLRHGVVQEQHVRVTSETGAPAMNIHAANARRRRDGARISNGASRRRSATGTRRRVPRRSRRA